MNRTESRTLLAGIDFRWSFRIPNIGSQGRSGRIFCAFSGVQSNNYWSSTTNANNTDNAWNVNLNNGNVNTNNKSNDNYVWPVRGGEW